MLKKLSSALVAVLISMVVAVLCASPAQAWSWSSSVTVTGQACTPYGAQSVYVRGELNQQVQYYSSGLGQPPTYRITFTNVPSGTSYAWIVFNCSVTGSYGKWLTMYRPTWGSTITANFLQ